MTGYLTGLLGDGITHSLTPPMHRREAAHLGLEYEYRVLDSAVMGLSRDDLPAVMAHVVAEGYTALNITHPFKQTVLPLLSSLSASADELQAVNLVLIRDGRLEGHNTDWTGFQTAFSTGLPDAPRRRVAQVGAGGAGAATAYALLRAGVEQLVIHDADARRAEDLADRYRAVFPAQRVEIVGAAAFTDALSDVDGVVQATPIGMHHSPGVAIELEALASEAWIADVVYLPLETQLVRQGRTRGHRVLDGGRMAVGQAADSLRLITGREPHRDRMAAHFVELVGLGREGVVS